MTTPGPAGATSIPALAARLAEVRGRVEAACERASRDPSEVLLVAVSKGASLAAVRAAIEAGARDLGENRAQELVPKADGLGAARALDALGAPGDRAAEARWHFIGHMQRNKLRDVLPRIHALHSVDSVRLVEAIDAWVAANAAPPLRCYLEVNVSGEDTKQGTSAAQLPRLLAAAASAPGIGVAGLMTVAPLATAPEAARPVFRSLRELALAHGLEGLSMGMTDDFEVAIEEGATVLRVGRAIFGERASG